MFLILVGSSGGVSYAAGWGGYSMYLYSYPNAIVADGVSTTTISCEVYDNNGNRVSDGIRVEFSTSLGNITPFAITNGGSAQAILRSVPTVGDAIVTVTAPSLGIVSRKKIDFLKPGTDINKDTYLSIESSKYLGYDIDTGTIDSTGGVKLRYKGITMNAYEAQVFTTKNAFIVRPKMGEYLVLKKQKVEINALELYVSISDGEAYGYIQVDSPDGVGKSLKLVSLRINDLEYEEITSLPRGVSFDFEPISNSSMYITAKLFIYEPKKEIKAKSPTVYVKGVKTFTVPFLRMSLYGGVGGVFGSFIAYGSDGLRIDLPIYLNLTATTSTAVRVQKDSNSVVGAFNTGNFWRIDLENEYGTGTDSSGMFEVMNLNQKDGWGLRLNNRTLFSDGGRFQGSVEYPNHENVFTNLNYSHNMKSFYYSLSFRSSYYESRRDTYNANAYVQTQSIPLSKYFNYTLSNQIYYDAAFVEKDARPGVRLGANLYSKYFDLGFSQFNISSSYTQNIQKVYGGNSVTLNAGLNAPLGDFGNLGLNYSYLKERSIEDYESNYISTDFYFWLSRISFRANGTYSFSDDNYNVFGEFRWTPIDYWSLRAMASYQYYPDSSYYDYKVSIGRQVGIQEYRIVWTYSTNRIDFEIGTIGF